MKQFIKKHSYLIAIMAFAFIVIGYNSYAVSVTDIEATDYASTSRVVINSNVNNLNSGKVENSGGDSLTGDYDITGDLAVTGTTTTDIIEGSAGNMQLVFDWAGTSTPNFCLGACY